MKKIFLIVVVIIIVVGGIYFWNVKNSYCGNYVLDEAHVLFNREQTPYSDKGVIKSPWDGSELEKIVIDPDDPEVMDEPWRHAYYSEVEDTFWIADMPGQFMQWFGPYNGHPCKK